MSSWQTALTERGVNVITEFSNNTILEKVYDSNYYTMNESKIDSACDFKGAVVPPTKQKKGTMEHIKFNPLPSELEENCIFLGTVTSQKDPFIQKVLEKKDEDVYIDKLKCANITFYHGALEKLSTGENDSFINKSGCALEVADVKEKVNKVEE